MAFESLSDKLQSAFKKLKGKGVLTEADINEAMREVKLALLEADGNFKVVKGFVSDVKEKCLGAEVLESLTPAQQIIKIVNQELVELMGGTGSKLTYSPSGFTTLMMVGLQGTGKTTTCGKLANYLKQHGKKPMLCACDIYRPAAIDQLEVVGKSVNTPVFTMRDSRNPAEIALAAKKEAEKKGFDVLIVDTAGRLHNKKNLMEELKKMNRIIEREFPNAHRENLVVLDGTTGQNALVQAREFAQVADLTGIVLTKMDGTAKGGIAVAIQSELHVPVKYIGVGEKIDDLQKFDPDEFVNALFDVQKED